MVPSQACLWKLVQAHHDDGDGNGSQQAGLESGRLEMSDTVSTRHVCPWSDAVPQFLKYTDEKCAMHSRKAEWPKFKKVAQDQSLTQ